MELLSVSVKHFHPSLMLPPFLLKSHLNSIIPIVAVLSVNIAQVFPDHICKCILCLPPPNASLIICVNIINVFSPGTVCYLNLNVHTFVLTGRLIMCLCMVCMSVNWTPGYMSVWLSQLTNCRTDFDEIYLSVGCEGLMVVTEYFWYMILCNLVKIYWLFYPEEGGSMFFWNVSKCPQWSKFGPLNFRTLHWLKTFGFIFSLLRLHNPEEQKPHGVAIFLVLLRNVDRTMEHIFGILALYCFTYVVVTCHHNSCASFSFYLCSSSVFLNLTFLLFDVCRIA